MNLVSFAVSFRRLVSSGCKFVYVRSQPDILDFTQSSPCGLTVYFKEDEAFVPLGDNLPAILGFLKETLFSDEITVIGWGLSHVFSFLRYHLRVPYDVKCGILDLKVLESMEGFKGEAPKALDEAISRLKAVVKGEGWQSLSRLYKAVYSPLICRVLPDIETLGVLDEERRIPLYSCYEIEGQANGRLSCGLSLKYCFNPHVIAPEERARLKPKSLDDRFVLFDYRHMEVSVLQWLSKDERLLQAIDADEDVYKSIFEILIGSKCDNEVKRAFCKSLFLPVVYGLGPVGLAEKLSVPQRTAETLVSRIYNSFPQAMSWIQAAQESDICRDFFGRTRRFDDKRHRARNFVVQSPAAIICLDKLIAVHGALASYGGVVASIHDGYLATANKAATRVVADIGKVALESEGELYPGLKLRVSCKIGRALSELSNNDSVQDGSIWQG